MPPTLEDTRQWAKGGVRPDLGITQLPELGASALCLPPSLAFLGQAGQGLWELRGSQSPDLPSPGALLVGLSEPKEGPRHAAWQSEGQLPNPENPGQGHAEGATAKPSGGKRGIALPSSPLSNTLDRCQLGSHVSVGIMCSEPAWAKLAQCQARQQSSNRTLSVTHMCPGCPEFFELAGLVLFCLSPSRRLQIAGKSQSDRIRAGPSPNLSLIPSPFLISPPPPSPRDHLFPLCPVFTIPLDTASHSLGAVPGREETMAKLSASRPSHSLPAVGQGRRPAALSTHRQARSHLGELTALSAP